MLAVPLILTIVYKYIPMWGIQIAFRDYKANRGIMGSEWIGMKWFVRFFTSPNCLRMIKNTFLLSLFSLLWSFPIPIILALLSSGSPATSFRMLSRESENSRVPMK